MTRRVLFLGNSYTYVNNLPQLIADMAASTGDTLVFDSNTPGGQNLGGHLADPVSVNKIKAGGFDYVVLQEQSMRPSFPDDWVVGDFLLYARQLDSLIRLYNPCGQTLFYMTWGYRDGNPDFCLAYPWWPYPCTYEVMDSLTQLRYCMAADSNRALVAPAGAVWHAIRHEDPSIELYDSDGSHPALAGTYATACCFYTAIFRKNPAFIAADVSLPDSVKKFIRDVTKTVVYDSLLKWHIGEYDALLPESCGSFVASGPFIRIFPNPASTHAVIQLPPGSGAALYLYDRTGTLIRKTGPLYDGTLQLQTIQMPAGLYFLRLVFPGGTVVTRRWIIVHS
jgi:hypothetical protein